MNYVLIGDVHSQAKNLENALNFIQKNIENARVIFLGDLFDSKNSYSDSLGVYQLVREAEKSLNAIVLQSNHQDKLIRYLRGNQIHLSNGLDKTVSELFNSIQLDELYNWLIHQPFGIVFRDNDNLEFRCAHAYFSDDVVVYDYSNEYFIWALRKEQKHQFLYGIRDLKKNRIEWWKKTNKPQSFIRVSGHYKNLTINLNNKSIVLDSHCGDLDGKLSIYDVNMKRLHQF